jgi:hypothetical protein
LKEVLEPPNPDVVVVVTGTLLWKSEHCTGLYELVRMYVTDTKPEESLAEVTEVGVLVS